MLKKVANAVGIGLVIYYAYERGAKDGISQFWIKLKEKAEKHPEMTLAQLVFEKEEI